ncbi:MAG: hydrogenase maturation protease [Coriobacteriales bacterium]|nr:hydrogenase maturation protease [Coriobacteriales bacterium]
MSRIEKHPGPLRVGVLCVGNILMRDEGVGPRVAAALRALPDWPGDVEILERGVMGMALLADIPRFDVLVVVDAVDKTGHAPGTVLSFTPDDIASDTVSRDAHGTRLADVLAAAALIGPLPQIQCLGVQVLDLAPENFSIGLTPPVEAALPQLVQGVLDLLATFGLPVPQTEPAASRSTPNRASGTVSAARLPPNPRP